MLDAHPALAACAEFEYAVDPFAKQDDFPAVEQLHEVLDRSRIFRSQGFKVDRSLGYRELLDSFLEQRMLTRPGSREIIALVHRHFEYLPQIWPKARYIHMIRDPRDVSRSVVNMGWEGDVWRGAGIWMKAEHSWDRLSKDLRKDQFIEIKAEDLITNTEQVLDQVCGFIGVPFESGMLDFHQKTTYEKPDASLVEQWRRKLSPRELSWVEGRVGSFLQSRGYEPSGIVPKEPGALVRLGLIFHHKYYRFCFQTRRYGFWLHSQHLLAKKLRLKSWQRRLQPRIDAIWKSSLK